jgi:hypothetical protein
MNYFLDFYFILFSVCFVFRQRAALGVVPRRYVPRKDQPKVKARTVYLDLPGSTTSGWKSWTGGLEGVKGPLQGMGIRHRDIIKAPVAGRKTERRICKIEQEEICQR